MFALIFVAISIALLNLSISYRHALLLKDKKRQLLVAFVFAAFNFGMSYLAFRFSAAIQWLSDFNLAYVSLGILWVLGLKAFFNTSKSRIGELIFDLTDLKVLILLAFSQSFETFLAATAVSLLWNDFLSLCLVVSVFSGLMMFLGFQAGNQKNALKSIKVFIILASLAYVLASFQSVFSLI